MSISRIFSDKGFTFIEVMVVVALLAVLSGVIFANFSGVRDGAKDTAMMAEFEQMQLALAAYNAQYDSYPLPASSCRSGFVEYVATDSGCASDYIDDLVSGNFIAQLPSQDDSSNASCDIEYRTDPSGNWYKLTAINCLGDASTAADGLQHGDKLARCPVTCSAVSGQRCFESEPQFYQSFAIYSFDAAAVPECK